MRARLRTVMQLLAKALILMIILGSVLQALPTQSSFLRDIFGGNSTFGAGDWVPPVQPLYWVEEDSVENQLAWQTPADPDLDGFNIYRSPDDTTYTLLTTLTAGDTSYTDTIVSPQTEYYYKLTSFDTTGNENDTNLIIGSYAQPLDVVIDDASLAADHNGNGTTTASADWEAQTVVNQTGSAQVAAANAVGGEHFALANGFADPSFSWTATASLQGQYDVYLSYVCRDTRDSLDVEIYSGATLVGGPITVDQSLRAADGVACSSDQADATAQAQWHYLGSFPLQAVPEVRVVAATGPNVRADAVGFTRTGVVAPTLVAPTSAAVVNPASLILDWSDVTDDVSVVSYEYEVSTDNTFTTVDYSGTGVAASQIDVSGFGLADATTYYWRVRACNSTPSCSSYSSTNSFVTDSTAPLSAITVTNSPTRDIAERVVNGGFESDLTGWSSLGDVTVITGSENGVSPMDSKMIRIGSDTSSVITDGNPVDVNILSQAIPHTSSGNGVRSLGFYYNFLTYDVEGFDEPGFMVFAGDKMVHQVWAGDVDTDGDSSTLDSTGWRFLAIDAAYLNDPTLTIAFYAGNSGDLKTQSFLYLDNVTTNEVVVDTGATFTISATDANGVDQVHYWYEVATVPVTGSSTSGVATLDFTLIDQPDNGLVKYWATDTVGNVEAQHSFYVSVDNQAPDAITDLLVTDEGDGDFNLSWTAPSEVGPFGVDQAARYELKYSISPILTTITDPDWEALPNPVIYNVDGLPGGGARAPLAAGRGESYQVHVNDGAATYYFAVRALDQANNRSNLVIGSIASTGVVTPVTSNSNPGDVLISEIMWMGSTISAADEWIELKNLTDQPINLENWTVENLGDGGSPIITLPAGATVPANGYFVIATYAASDSNSALLNEPEYVTPIELDDLGEQLTLKDVTAQIIDQTPVTAGSWAAGENTADKKSMERNNNPGLGFDLDGTNSLNWHSCDSTSCAEARALYFDAVAGNYGTPAGDNLSLSADQVKPAASLQQVSDQEVQFKLTSLTNILSFDYTLSYDHQYQAEEAAEPATVTDAIQGQHNLNPSTRDYLSPLLYLGTCSTNGEVCVPHVSVSNLLLTLTFQDAQGKTHQLEVGTP